MDRHLTGKAVTARFLGFAAQRRGIAEVDRDGVDGLHPRRRGAGKAERAREPVRVEEAAVAVAVGLRAELGRKVFGSPGQFLEPGARAAIRAGEKQRGRGLRRDRHDLDRTVGQARDRLTRQKLRAGTTASRSASARPVVNPLMRTRRRGRCAALTASVMKAAARMRASVLPCAGIESSRSTITASAPLAIALSSFFPSSAGTKSSERITAAACA